MGKRLLSAAIGIALFVAVLFLNDNYHFVFNILISVISVISIWEIFAATKYIENKALLIVSLVFAATVPFFRTPYFNVASKSACFIYVILLFLIMLIDHKKVHFEEIGTTFMMCTLLPFAFSSLIYLRNLGLDSQYGLVKRDGVFFIVMACAGAWIADTGAFFTGKLFGKHKLAPEISPKKTVEGFIGGVIFNIIGFICAGLLYEYIDPYAAKVNVLAMAIIGFVCAFAGTIGDLSASFIKRSCNIKDFGNIMPGHGGILDRFDSVMMVAPLMYVTVCVFQPLMGIIIR